MQLSSPKTTIFRPIYAGNDSISDQEKGELVKELNKSLQNVKVDASSLETISSERCSIYKIPKFMREVDLRAYEPKLVSFGPYHYGKPHLLPMEKIKQKGFLNFIIRYKLDVKTILYTVAMIFDRLWDSYDNLDQDIRKQELLKVLIVDGCFMMDFLGNCPSYLHSKFLEINRDMLLLENQLPIDLIHLLYSLAKYGVDKQVLLNDKIGELVTSLICEKILSIGTEEAAAIRFKLHILDIHRESLLYSPMGNRYWSGVRETYDPSAPGWCQIIPQATELHKLGIKFKKSDTESLTDVHFDPKQGVLELPYLVLSNDIDTRLLNVMAFEKLHIYTGSEVMSYVWLMKNLIVDDKDVSELASSGILSNNEMQAGTGTGGVVELFNLLAKGTRKDQLDSHISKVFKQLNDHCNNPWTKWWVNLKDPRTQNPWAIISIGAASFGFLLQIMQTIFQVYEHFRPTH